MGQRLLKITPELITSLLQGMKADDHPRYFRVVRNPLPEDVRVLAVRCSPYWPDMVEVDLESDTWEPAPARTEVEPWFQAVYIEVPADGVHRGTAAMSGGS